MLADATTHGYEVKFEAEHSRAVHDFAVEGASGPVKFLEGSRMAASAVETASGSVALLLYAQTDGNDISMYTRDRDDGLWTSDRLPVDVD